MKKTRVEVNFPPQFSKFIYDIKTFEFEGDNVSDFINKLEFTFGNIRERLLDNEGNVRPYINVFIGQKSIKSLQGLNSVIREGEKISLLLSRAGG
jgi:molybdopterin converting factor small subunit